MSSSIASWFSSLGWRSRWMNKRSINWRNIRLLQSPGRVATEHSVRHEAWTLIGWRCWLYDWLIEIYMYIWGLLVCPALFASCNALWANVTNENFRHFQRSFTVPYKAARVLSQWPFVRGIRRWGSKCYIIGDSPHKGPLMQNFCVSCGFSNLMNKQPNCLYLRHHDAHVMSLLLDSIHCQLNVNLSYNQLDNTR